MLKRSSVTLKAAAAAGALLVLASACSTGPGQGSDGSTGAGAQEDTGTIDKLAEGTESPPPSDSPPPATGKSVWWISCGQQTPSCSNTTAGGEEAAKALGWDFHIADGQLSTADFAAGIRTALAANPDAIVVSGFNCPQVQGAVQDAVQQGVKIIGPDSFDCLAVGGPQLYNVPMIPGPAVPDVDAYWRSRGTRAAQYIIAKTGGRAKIINNSGHDVPLQEVINEGFLKEIKKCSGCEIVDTVNFDSSQLGPEGQWIQAFRTSLVQHPEATATFLPLNLMMSSSGGAQAVQESGHDLIVFGGSTDLDTINLLRQGRVDAITSAFDEAWVGWAAMDELNRSFNGGQSVPEGVGFTIIDKDHNLPKDTGTGYKASVDFRSAYLKAWGRN
jgi:ribose transport system substrate-binding protein